MTYDGVKDEGSNGDTVIRVLIADDHPVVRVGVAGMLKSNPDIALVGEAANIDETLQALQNLNVDVIVLDIVMGDSTDIESIRRVLELVPNARIVVYTASRQLEVAIQSLDFGVQGYLLKDSPHPGLAMAIRIVHEGGTFIDPNISKQFVGRYRGQDRTETSLGLTEREREVLGLVAEGSSNRGIADKLCISERTVKFHVSSILGKLGAQNRTEAVRIATRGELLGDVPKWH